MSENEFCEECQHSRSICDGEDNADCACVRECLDRYDYYADACESDYGDGPGA